MFNPLLSLATIGNVVTVLKEAAPIVELVGKGFGMLASRQSLPEKMTPKQAELANTTEVSFDVREILTNSLPEKILNDVNDKSKDTIKTIESVQAAIKELDSVLEGVKQAAKKVDQAIPDNN